MYNEIKDIKRIVIKVGTSTLTHQTGRLNIRRVESLVKVISDLKNMGKEIILVSSGAIGVGAGCMGMTERPREKVAKQAAAAVGQCELMNIYAKMFREYEHTVAQILLTKDVVEVPESKENAINTFMKLLEYGVIPIVNENDTISTKEAEFGDNDTLSAVVAVLAEAGLLIILSDIDGVYDSNPKEHADAKLINIVENVDDIMDVAGGAGSSLGTGGMVTKLEAAKIAGAKGIHTIIMNGSTPKHLYDITSGIPVGTLLKGDAVK
ncbi:MAG: glutamate 5-kinase [Clostridia bacterium]|nr:glutamate 5-kinase [Clostridia bacterium]